jgi:hypothetical protein
MKSGHVKGPSLSQSLSQDPHLLILRCQCVSKTHVVCIELWEKNIVALMASSPSRERTGLSTIIASVESQSGFGGQVPRQVSHVSQSIIFWHVSLPWTNWVIMLEVRGWYYLIIVVPTWDQQSVTHLKKHLNYYEGGGWQDAVIGGHSRDSLANWKQAIHRKAWPVEEWSNMHDNSCMVYGSQPF